MDKTSAVFGGVIGGIIVVIVFALYLAPHRLDIPQQDLITTNEHNLEVIEETPIRDIGEISLADLFEKSDDGVVKVSVRKSTELPTGRSLGSGFVYDVSGHIITNNHVVEDSQKTTVTFLDGTSYNAKVIGTDPYTDLAVLKVDVNPSLLHPLPLGDSSTLRVGEQVAAIGNPFGLSGSMTSGIVSQLGRLLSTPGTASFSIPDVIQTDAAVNPGNSGGPLLNMKGQVIGINTAIQSGTGEFAGIGFAVPSNTVSKIVPILIKEGKYKHPWLGISGVDIDPDLANVLGLQDTRGLLIVSVVKDSPAEKAGLHGSTETKEIDGIKYQIGGDVILSVDHKDVRKIDDILIHLQREKKVGDTIDLEILREGRVTNFKLILDERPNNNQP
ncbi:MAG TPA: trypsin-like peptidase domain-containing protein [Nitrosopumilaceae archaeon]|nr:trypsin-like peptidase domain-containing protein [Nitrosopumilaceae archaeon]